MSCGSTEATLGQNLTLVSNQPFSLVCSLENTSAEEFSAMLFTSQLSPGGQRSGSLSTPRVAGNTVTQVTLPFQPVFQNGTYTYTFTLTDSETSKPLANEVTLTGTLGSADGKQVRIMTATVDKGAYQWGEVFTLALSLDVPEGKSAADVTATVVMQDMDGQVCSTLLEKRILTKAEDTLKLTFPKVAGTCVNAIGLILQSKDGTIVDKRTIAVGLTLEETAGMTPATGQDMAVQESGSGLSTLMIGVLVFVVVFLVVLVGYAMMRRKSSVV
jgi:hypothetical protein